MSSIDVKYRDGKLNTVIMHNPEKISVNDCRGCGGRSFISVNVRDDQVGSSIFLSSELAEELHAELGKLFAVDAATQDVETAASAV